MSRNWLSYSKKSGVSCAQMELSGSTSGIHTTAVAKHEATVELAQRMGSNLLIAGLTSRVSNPSITLDSSPRTCLGFLGVWLLRFRRRGGIYAQKLYGINQPRWLR